MVVKRAGERAGAKPAPSHEEVERLARELADRPFGGDSAPEIPAEPAKAPEQPKRRRSITLSLPSTVVEQLEALALENKHKGKKDGHNVSALVLAALKKAGYKP